jgi:hypothetical protein
MLETSVQPSGRPEVSPIRQTSPPPHITPRSRGPRHSLNPERKTRNSTKHHKAVLLASRQIMPACCPFPPAAAALSRTRARANARPVSAASRESRVTRRLLPVAVAVVMLMTSAALGVARAQGVWSTAQLSVARGYLAAASVGNVALFAGGYTLSAILSREGGLGDIVYCFERVLCFVFCACCGIAVMFALWLLPLSCAQQRVVKIILPLLWMSTTLQQGHGRRLTSAWRDIGL